MNTRPEHIVFNANGSISASKTLRKVMQSFINSKYGDSLGEVIRVDFLSAISNAPYALRVKFRHQSSSYLKNVSLLSHMHIDFNLDATKIDMQTNRQTMTTEVHFTDPKAIIQLFKTLGYDNLLTDDSVCLSCQVDLLQLLITETLYFIITSRQVSKTPPEEIEFDQYGQLTAIVTSPQKIPFKLNNFYEVVQFVDQYCQIKLPPHFVALLRQQILINTLRYSRYLLSNNADGIPWILANNQVSVVNINDSKKHLLLDITEHKLSPQDQRIFQVSLSELLGADFVLNWLPTSNSCVLVIKSRDGVGFYQHNIACLIQIFTQYKLLPERQLNLLMWDNLIGAPAVSSYTIPEVLENSLSCSIMRCLPNEDDVLVITPSGNNYQSSSIYEVINTTGKDPFTREKLEVSQVRVNKLANELIAYFRNPMLADDPLIHRPELLINPHTGNVYVNPVVLPSGETVDYDLLSATEQATAYRNLCIEELINYYAPTELVAITAPIERAGIRATIGVNIARICPGPRTLSDERARDEMDLSYPFVNYSTNTNSLSIAFTFMMDAENFIKSLAKVINSSQLRIENYSIRLNIQTLQGENQTLSFQSTVYIDGDENIQRLIEDYCKLSPEYFIALQRMSGSENMDIMNYIIKTGKLGQWEDSDIEDEYQYATLRTSNTTANILEMQALSAFDNMRLTTILEEDIEEEGIEEDDNVDSVVIAPIVVQKSTAPDAASEENFTLNFSFMDEDRHYDYLSMFDYFCREQQATIPASASSSIVSAAVMPSQFNAFESFLGRRGRMDDSDSDDDNNVRCKKK